MDYFQFHLYFNTYNEFLNTYRLQVATLLKCRIKTTLQYNTKGAQEVDQQWINSGAKQCSQHLNKKISLPICFFLDQTK